MRFDGRDVDGGPMRSRFHPFPRRELKRLRKAWLRRNAGMLSALLVGFVLLLALLSFLLVRTDAPGRWYVLGLLHAGLTAAALHAVNSAFLAHERGAVLQLRGAWGEDNTRSELQRAKRRRLVWDWVDSITLQAGDLDHVVITRSGGIVVLDSKWRTEVTPGVVAEMTASAKRTQTRAEALARTLLKADRSARHRAAGQPFTVTPAVVLWGAARQTVPEGHRVEDVHFVDGRELVSWLAQLDGPAITREAAKDLHQRLTDYRAKAFKANQDALAGQRGQR